LPIFNTINHLGVIIFQVSVLIFVILKEFLLEVKLFHHALIEDKGLVVTNQEGEKAGQHRKVTSE